VNLDGLVAELKSERDRLARAIESRAARVSNDRRREVEEDGTSSLDGSPTRTVSQAMIHASNQNKTCTV
jgi:hypothetical protein